MTKFYFLTIFILLTCSLSAQDGELDSLFGVDGSLYFDSSQGGGSDTGSDVIPLPDGKILAVSSARPFDNTEIAVMRFLYNGDVDSTFATNGVYYMQQSTETDLPYAAYVDDEGSIYVCGGFGTDKADNPDFGVLKLDSEGTPDSLFGGDGIVTIEIDTSQDYARDMVFTADNKIILAGYTYVPGFNTRNMAAVRLNIDGSIDSTFSDDGIFVWENGDGTNELYTLILDENENIFTSGYSKVGGAEFPIVYKILADGSSLDSSFALNGAFMPPIEGRCQDLQYHPEGFIVGSGRAAGSGGAANAMIFAFTKAGELVMEFGNNGYTTSQILAINVLNELVIQPDGKIIAGGEATAGFFGDKGFITMRVNSDGSIDETWGNDGTTFHQTGSFISFANGIAMQPVDGKILIIGASNATTANDVTILRFNNFIDQDLDGVEFFSDCDDNDINVFQQGTFFIDADGDGYDVGSEELCYGAEIPDGYAEATSGDDCDDTNADVYQQGTFFVDADGDGYDVGSEEVCYGAEIPDGYAEATAGDDCDDTNADVYQLGTFFIDADGDGYDNGSEEVCYGAEVPDGYASETSGDDCDDTDAAINPGAEEIEGNDIDEDCDGSLVRSINTELNNSISIYPNPAIQNFINIELKDITFEIYEIQMVNLLGQEVMKAKIDRNTSSMKLDVSHIVDGTYFIKFKSEQGDGIKKFIKL